MTEFLFLAGAVATGVFVGEDMTATGTSRHFSKSPAHRVAAGAPVSRAGRACYAWR